MEWSYFSGEVPADWEADTSNIAKAHSDPTCHGGVVMVVRWSMREAREARKRRACAVCVYPWHLHGVVLHEAHQVRHPTGGY
jgi:hypothetical protein